MQATLRVEHKAIGAEVRRNPYEVVLDGEPVGAVEMNGTFEVLVGAGRHTESRSTMAESPAAPSRSRPPRGGRFDSAAPARGSCRSSSCLRLPRVGAEARPLLRRPRQRQLSPMSWDFLGRAARI